jgi:cytochrome P450
VRKAACGHENWGNDAMTTFESRQANIRRPHPPGPKGLPLVGVAPSLRQDLIGALERGFHEHGDYVLYPVGPRRGPSRLRRDILAVHHPTSVEQVLGDRHTFTRATSTTTILSDLVGQGLATTDGEVWKRQRRTVQALFTPRQVARHGALMEQEADRLVADGYLGVGTETDVSKAMRRYALRVLGRTLFRDEEGLNEVFASLDRLVPLVGEVVRSRSASPFQVPLGWPTTENRRFRAVRTDLYATIDYLLARHASRANGGEGEDLVDRLNATPDPQTGQHLSSQEIRDQALVFLLAGFTTTENALTFTLYLLGRNPVVQDNVAAAQPDGTSGEDLVRGSILEALRIYPPAYAIGRRAMRDTEIGGYPVRQGTNIVVSPWITHRHPEFWVEPERFDPTRFVGAPERPKHAYFPFGAGPHACIGEHFSLLESTTLLRALLARFRIESLDRELPLSQRVSLRPAQPVRVKWINR